MILDEIKDSKFDRCGRHAAKKREILFKGDTQAADSRRKMNRNSIQIDRERERQAFLVVFRSDENHLCLIKIQLNFLVVCHQICMTVKP